MHYLQPLFKTPLYNTAVLYRVKLIHIVFITGLLATITATSHVAAASATQQTSLSVNPDQTRLYQNTLIAIRKGQLKTAQRGLYQLNNYPLIPYVEKALLYKRIHHLSKQQAQTFLDQYQGSVPAKQFRHKWLSHLAKKQRWQSFIEFYNPDQASQDINCHYLTALHDTQQSAAALSKTPQYWLTAKSLPKSCDRPLQKWQQAGLLSNKLMWQRIKLAIDSGNYQLLNYLSKKSDITLKSYISQLRSIDKKPQQLLNVSSYSNNNSYTKDIILYGLEKLADQDINLTLKLWPKYQQNTAFNDTQQQHIKQIIGRHLIASGSNEALPWLIKNDPNSEDEFLLTWRILLAVKQQQWSTANRWITLLPTETQQKPQWQYWLAKSQIRHQPNHTVAQESLKKLAKQRHYYGFLAAELLQLPYVITDRDTPHTIDMQSFINLPAIQRAKVFYSMNEITAARREWYQATQFLTAQQQVSASAIANQWGWHQQAILSSTKASYKDDLTLRFPLAFQHNIIPAAKATELEAEWIYAITRQESAFATDALSPAGAKGLMQLRPSTAKEVAKQAGLSYKRNDIYQANTNILLGSHYLQQLLSTFDGNRVLATAAYNAGPYRVKRWLNQQPKNLEYDVWIETLPYYETRNYIKNVLVSSVIYGYRMGNKTTLVTNNEQRINYNNKQL